MKKITLLLFVLSAFLFTNVSAQEVNMKSKRGENILPEKGDWAIGISATPILDFFGNVTKINSTNSFANPAQWKFITIGNTDYDSKDQIIYGKYFLSDKK